MRALILEDNRDRRVAMIGRLADRFPFLGVSFFDTAQKIIDFMHSGEMKDVVLISLDHDLELIPDTQGSYVDPGTGLDVARWLSQRPEPICPVVVHTTNSRAGSRMIRLLEKSHWTSHRVIPHDDLLWIETDWFRVARNAIVDFAPHRRASPIFQEESKVSLIRALLAGQYESGQAFCRQAIARIRDAYVRDLKQVLGDASGDVVALVDKGILASVLETDGPIARWVREEGIPSASLFELAEQGPQAIDVLPFPPSATEILFRSGIRHLQLRIIEVADMQAILAVAASHSLATSTVQATITELKQAIEIAIFASLQLQPSGNNSKAAQPKRPKSIL